MLAKKGPVEGLGWRDRCFALCGVGIRPRHRYSPSTSVSLSTSILAFDIGIAFDIDTRFRHRYSLLTSALGFDIGTPSRHRHSVTTSILGLVIGSHCSRPPYVYLSTSIHGSIPPCSMLTDRTDSPARSSRHRLDTDTDARSDRCRKIGF